jgi:hypothetical protein
MYDKTRQDKETQNEVKEMLESLLLVALFQGFAILAILSK